MQLSAAAPDRGSKGMLGETAQVGEKSSRKRVRPGADIRHNAIIYYASNTEVIAKVIRSI